MAYMKVMDTTRKRNGKPVKSYAVIWREPVHDDFGLPVPEGAARPDGLKKMRNRSERYPTRPAAQARVDELNAAKHTTGTSALAEQRKAGELPFGYYARAWLDEQAVKVSQGKLKARTVDEYARGCCGVTCSVRLAGLLSQRSPRHTARSCWLRGSGSPPGKATRNR